jgi:tripartite-type tricarboxylate transporter receptor subunit TctC
MILVSRRKIMAFSVIAAAASFVSMPISAQTDWPSKDIRFVVALPAGGGPDIFVRALAEPMRAVLGKAVIVDNKPGASGLIGARLVAQAPADGHTLFYVTSGLVTVQAMNPKFDLLKELKMVSRLSHSPFAMVVPANSPYKTAQELIVAVKASPGKLSYGSGGVGSPAHLAVEHIEDRVGDFKALHVPYKGAIESFAALVGGQIDFSVSLLGPAIPLVQSGKLRILGITSRNRLAQLPNVPTLTELSVPGFVFEAWGGIAVPAGTPDEVVERLAQISQNAIAQPAVKELAFKQGSVLEYMDSKTLTAQIIKDIPQEQKLVKKLGMTME